MPASSASPLVLIVDNDVAVNELLRTILSDRGMTCESAHDGEQALARVRAGGVGVLVTDLDMPNLDGQGLLSQLSELAEAPDSIVVSGYLDPEIERSLQDLPVVRHVLHKPFDVMLFADRVAALVARRPSGSEAR